MKDNAHKDAEKENEGGQAMKIARYPTRQAEDTEIYLVFLEREKEKRNKQTNETNKEKKGGN